MFAKRISFGYSKQIKINVKLTLKNLKKEAATIIVSSMFIERSFFAEKSVKSVSSISNLLFTDIEAMSQIEIPDEVKVVSLPDDNSTYIYQNWVVTEHYYSPH